MSLRHKLADMEVALRRAVVSLELLPSLVLCHNEAALLAINLQRGGEGDKAEKTMERSAESKQLVAKLATPAGSGSGSGLSPDHYQYYHHYQSIADAIICACAKGEIEEALDLFAELPGGWTTSVATFTALILACEKGHKVEKSLELFAVMQQIGMAPT